MPEIRPNAVMWVDYRDSEETAGDVANKISSPIKDELQRFINEGLKKAEAEISWDSLCIIVFGQQLRWSAADLFDQLFRWLDDEPQETAQVIEELLPTLKKAVAELEKRAKDAA